MITPCQITIEQIGQTCQQSQNHRTKTQTEDPAFTADHINMRHRSDDHKNQDCKYSAHSQYIRQILPDQFSKPFSLSKLFVKHFFITQTPAPCISRKRTSQQYTTTIMTQNHPQKGNGTQAAASPPRRKISGRMKGILLVFVPEQFELLLAFVFGDLFTPFLFQVTHCKTSLV